MKIETKFNPGDEVWVMKKNRPHMFKVDTVNIAISKNSVIDESYKEFESGITMMDSDKEWNYDFSECFATKKELLDSFLEDEE